MGECKLIFTTDDFASAEDAKKKYHEDLPVLIDVTVTLPSGRKIKKTAIDITDLLIYDDVI